MKRIVIILVILILVIFNLFCSFWESDEFFYKNSYEILSVPDESDIKTLYSVKNLSVSENGYIFVGTNHGIFMFNKDGKCINFIALSVDYMYKINKNKLIIVFDNTGKEECYYSTCIISKKGIKQDSYDVFSCYFKDYCDKNGFENSKTVKKGDTEYEYQFYGKVKITKNGESKILNLEKKWFPLPFEYILIFDGTLLFAFLVVTVVKVVKKKK